MKSFVVSKRFWIPFLVMLLTHIVALTWNIWMMYKDDFEGKILPPGIKTEWLWRQVSGKILLQCFLLAFIVGIIFYAHRAAKKDGEPRRPLSLVNMIFAGLFSLLGFLHTSFYEPVNFRRGTGMLTEIIYARPGETVQLEKMNSDDRINTPRTMTLPQLYQARNAVKSNEATAFDNFFGDNKRKISFSIAEKIAMPFTIIAFYLLGAVMGISFRRTHVIFPVLIVYFIVFSFLQFIQSYLERLYKREELSVFWGAYGMTVFAIVLAIVLLLILHSQGIFRRYNEEELYNIDESKPDIL
jgi:hypothetical protein